MSRADLVDRIAQVVGRDILHVEDAGDGWPARAAVITTKGVLPVTLYVAPVTLSHRERDAVERRVQNPGQGRAILHQEGCTPLLLGTWEEEGPLVIAAYDAARRIGHETRWSAFISLDCLRRAAQSGWSEEMSTDGERRIAFTPDAFPAYSAIIAGDETVSQSVRGLHLSSQEQLSLGGTGVHERERRTLTAIVRDAKFRGKVHSAYGGRCAMCRMGLGLVQGAYLFPASADASPDEAWNGVALCPNHHAAFDRHLVAIRERDFALVFHPSVVEAARTDPVTAAFVTNTLSILAPPLPGHSPPDPAMLRRRYLHFQGQYDWLA